MAEHPRDELRRRIAEAIRRSRRSPNEYVSVDDEAIADAIVGMFNVRERHRDDDVTTWGDMREQIQRHRFIVAELAREGEPERIEGAWRG